MPWQPIFAAGCADHEAEVAEASAAPERAALVSRERRERFFMIAECTATRRSGFRDQPAPGTMRKSRSAPLPSARSAS